VFVRQSLKNSVVNDRYTCSHKQPRRGECVWVVFSGGHAVAARTLKLAVLSTGVEWIRSQIAARAHNPLLQQAAARLRPPSLTQCQHGTCYCAGYTTRVWHPQIPHQLGGIPGGLGCLTIPTPDVPDALGGAFHCFRKHRRENIQSKLRSRCNNLKIRGTWCTVQHTQTIHSRLSSNSYSTAPTNAPRCHAPSLAETLLCRCWLMIK
jgi:hypothetical protein